MYSATKRRRIRRKLASPSSMRDGHFQGEEKEEMDTGKKLTGDDLPVDMLNLIIITKSTPLGCILRFGMATKRNHALVQDRFNTDFNFELAVHEPHYQHLLYQRRIIKALFFTSHPRTADATDDGDGRVQYYGQDCITVDRTANSLDAQLNRDRYDDIPEKLHVDQDSKYITAALRPYAVHVMRTADINRIWAKGGNIDARTKKAIENRWKHPIDDHDISFTALFRSGHVQVGDCNPFYSLHISVSMYIYVSVEELAEITIEDTARPEAMYDLAWIPMHEMKCDCEENTCRFAKIKERSYTVNVTVRRPGDDDLGRRVTIDNPGFYPYSATLPYPTVE